MTEELKTLKDFEDEIEITFKGFSESFVKTKSINGDKLRKEAIKWIKFLKERNYDIPVSLALAVEVGELAPNFKERIIYTKKGIADWIKHFFNITEEDLK